MWQFWVDRGGTFTDIVAKSPEDRISIHKYLSENPERYRDAAIHGIREILGLQASAPMPDFSVEAIKMGTTVATNALLERKGSPTLLAITGGLADCLRIGYQHRPDIFARQIILPEQLYSRVVEIDERVLANGVVERSLSSQKARSDLQAAYDDGFRAIAIVLMHAYNHPSHELELERIANEIGFEQISVSHQVSPLIKIVGRGDTTVVDAYLSPILRRYVDQVASRAGDARLMFMQSNGGLVDARKFQGKDAILSGPAGGVVGASQTASIAGFDSIITFDMGGTSTDVAHVAGNYERVFETEVAGVRMRAPMMSIHTVAAGGGSIIEFDGQKLKVGPESAGASPGPACYRRGGPLAVTDANLMTGKLIPSLFPAVFGQSGDLPLDADIVRQKFEAMADAMLQATGEHKSPKAIAHGALAIANDNMANAIKEISIARGIDVSGYTLQCFGGAGSQHACQVADLLGIRQVMIHPLASVLSAYGMGLAEIRTIQQRGLERTLDQSLEPVLEKAIGELQAKATKELIDQNVTQDRIVCETRLHIRYQGTDSSLEVAAGTATAMRQAFEAEHLSRYGFIVEGRGLIAEQLVVEGIGSMALIDEDAVSIDREVQVQASETTLIFTNAAPHQPPELYDAGIFNRDSLAPGHIVSGPALVTAETTTVIVEPGWQLRINSFGHMIMQRVQALPDRVAVGTSCDPILLEIFNNLFMTIAEQMGVTLQNTAYSVNVKERLDFSCAVFDAEGGLIANAPHMPVHLGSMGESVRAIIRLRAGTMKLGDVFALNNPYNGGTHLPDVTVILPIFDEAGEVIFFTASRAHHADIGGITPGSMPPDSTHIDQEGVLFDNFHLVEDGKLRLQALEELLASGPHPARNLAQNVADLQAQIASCNRGANELNRMIGQFGLETVRAYMAHVMDNAEESVRRVIDVLKPGSFVYEHDNGSVIKVTIDIDHATRSASIDFTGTSPQIEGNVNAPAAVTRAAVLYVFRALVDANIPLNDGCLKPITLTIPEGSILNCRYPAAVCAGNVEASQWCTDTLFGALGVMAAAQGTMNNFTFGNDQYQYYETICGGSGAGNGFDGTSAVHTHMTNSRLTDPEILEHRYPVVLESHKINRGSGGKGRFKGGDGTIRTIRFMETMEAASLANHRRIPPFGLNGGSSGACGNQWVTRADGSVEPMKGADKAYLEPGDCITIQTPTGGGFGNSDQNS